MVPLYHGLQDVVDHRGTGSNSTDTELGFKQLGYLMSMFGDQRIPVVLQLPILLDIYFLVGDCEASW